MSVTQEKKRNPKLADDMFVLVWEGSESIDEVIENLSEIFGVTTNVAGVRTRASKLRSMGLELKKFDRGPREKLSPEEKAKRAKKRLAEKADRLQALMRSIKSPRLRNEALPDLVERFKERAEREKAKAAKADK